MEKNLLIFYNILIMIFYIFIKQFKKYIKYFIDKWGLGPIPNPQSPIPNPQSPIPNLMFSNQ